MYVCWMPWLIYFIGYAWSVRLCYYGYHPVIFLVLGVRMLWPLCCGLVVGVNPRPPNAYLDLGLQDFITQEYLIILAEGKPPQ